MLILYKNDRNVRFVLFTKTLIVCFTSSNNQHKINISVNHSFGSSSITYGVIKHFEARKSSYVVVESIHEQLLLALFGNLYSSMEPKSRVFQINVIAISSISSIALISSIGQILLKLEIETLLPKVIYFVVI